MDPNATDSSLQCYRNKSDELKRFFFKVVFSSRNLLKLLFSFSVYITFHIKLLDL